MKKPDPFIWGYDRNLQIAGSQKGNWYHKTELAALNDEAVLNMFIVKKADLIDF